MSPMGDQLMWLLFLHFVPECVADLCNWRGSGLTRDPHSRTVQQVKLRCTEGTVEWVYPNQALRVVLEPNLSSTRHTTACVKFLRGFGGASVFIERAGELDLLVTEGGRPEQVYCFRTEESHKTVIFLQAGVQEDITSRTVGFQYELLGKTSTAPDFRAAVVQAACRPCNDTELLLAICSSDFVVRGDIREVSHDPQRQTSLIEVTGARVYRQRGDVFERELDERGAWQGRVHTLMKCRVKAGKGHFLFMGAEHFGEAWLGCAPRYMDFMRVYRAAWQERRNPCEFPLD